MSLNIYLKTTVLSNVYFTSIPASLNQMATEAGLYDVLWRPENIGATYAGDLITPLRDGLDKLKSNPKKYEQFNPTGWGSYQVFISFVEDYLNACIQNPDAKIEVLIK